MNYAPNAAPLVVSYGMGVDSTAMLVGMQQRGIRPDLILFADTGGEKPETYAYLPVIDAWLASVGFPAVTVVRYKPTRARYDTLEGKCLMNETLPSLAFGMHSCALVFKVEPQDRYLSAWQPAIDVWASGGRVVKALGYDGGCQDRRRSAKAVRAVEKTPLEKRKFDFTYPLQDWNVDRAGCIALIESAGLPVPPKSACFFCPASTKREIVELRDSHPDLYWRAVSMERRARDGKHGLDTVKGLGRRFAWEDMLAAEAADFDDDDSAATLRP